MSKYHMGIDYAREGDYSAIIKDGEWYDLAGNKLVWFETDNNTKEK